MAQGKRGMLATDSVPEAGTPVRRQLPPAHATTDHVILKPGDAPPNRPSATVIRNVFHILGALYKEHPLHVNPADHFNVLVATMLSARTRDPTTNEAMARLWPVASTPEQMLKLPVNKLAAILKPVGFWNAKARFLHGLSRMLLERFDGKVPRTREKLMELPGVGRKVANLVLNICFNEPAICVDVHVQRVTNRLGWIATATPEATEEALVELLPEKLWAPTNLVFVNHGQQICQPVIPWCSKCPIYKYCARVNVLKNR